MSKTELARSAISFVDETDFCTNVAAHNEKNAMNNGRVHELVRCDMRKDLTGECHALFLEMGASQ